MAEYTYDAFGRRVKKRIVSGGQNVQEIAYHYVDYSLSVAKETERLWVTDHWGAWRTRREYLLNGGLAAHIVGVRHYDYSGGGAPVVKLYRYVYDPSGNVAAVLDEDGLMVYVDKDGNIETASAADNVACRFEYDAYGNNIYPPDDWNKRTAMEKAWVIFPHHISTKEWDSEANLYYFGYRWYEPRQGAYVSRTPLGPLQEGTYIFCLNNPVMYFDPNGLLVVGILVTGSFIPLVGGQIYYYYIVDDQGWFASGIGVGLGAGFDIGLSGGVIVSDARSVDDFTKPSFTGNCAYRLPLGAAASYSTDNYSELFYDVTSDDVNNTFLGLSLGLPGASVTWSPSKMEKFWLQDISPWVDENLPDNNECIDLLDKLLNYIYKGASHMFDESPLLMNSVEIFIP